MANRDYNYRKYKRYVKGIKRIKIDRAEHGNPQYGVGGHLNWTCECFCSDADKGKGKLFSRFADTPKYYKSWWDMYDAWEHKHHIPIE